MIDWFFLSLCLSSFVDLTKMSEKERERERERKRRRREKERRREKKRESEGRFLTICFHKLFSFPFGRFSLQIFFNFSSHPSSSFSSLFHLLRRGWNQKRDWREEQIRKSKKKKKNLRTGATHQKKKKKDLFILSLSLKFLSLQFLSLSSPSSISFSSQVNVTCSTCLWCLFGRVKFFSFSLFLSILLSLFLSVSLPLKMSSNLNHSIKMGIKRTTFLFSGQFHS